MQRLLQQDGVPADNLLPAQAADTGGFQANVLYRPGDIVKHHKIADFERLIKTDGERCKHVAQDRLHREGDSNTPYPKAGNQSSDVDARVSKNRQQHH
ncbi:Uncharacterised protein [Enterobacter hormaechei]|nr:Uncharacterised protein [Enterobacter hormaechei]CZY05071.1 Uncharacterised protein [Enterobacter hormaechei]CZZ57415.1 Uncharacterised protein [Enterobacter hormaechei]SAA45556.1 Uncharacterised protein [Enterobacter hormaechei]SAB60727.1 Uncharacterised protein [Enterobacter hormaechei]